jgi:hypothetical protein
MKKTILVIAGTFVSGVIFGANKPLRKLLSPAAKASGKGGAKAYESVLKFIMKRKEYIEDRIAEARIRKHENNTETTIALS